MISTGPRGILPAMRAGSEGVGAADPAKSVPGAVSGARGEASSRAAPAETARAVDPVSQGRKAAGLPRDESNERASEARGLIEPDRPDPAMFAAEAPTEATPAGPPPTFDVSILEKARAVAAATPLPPAVQKEAAPEADNPAWDTSLERAMVGEPAQATSVPRSDRDNQRSPDDRAEIATWTDPTPRGAPTKPEVPGETA